ncbi:OsmC family protein, partial [Candidatus Bathyarchaeota archaeon]|nr:OsmC family protein [Candidatus Bathyarchaeota archaeon]
PENRFQKMGSEARQLLAASLVECMCSTLISLLNWARVDLKMFQAEAKVISGKDEEGRLCIDSINVNVNIGIPEDEETLRKLKRAEILFERGCLMSRSLKRGIKVNYSVNRHFER